MLDAKESALRMAAERALVKSLEGGVVTMPATSKQLTSRNPGPRY